MFEDKLLQINKYHLFDEDLLQNAELLDEIDSWLYETSLTDSEAISLVKAMQKVEREPTSLVWAAIAAIGASPNWKKNEAILFLPDWFEIQSVEEEVYRNVSHIEHNFVFDKNINFKVSPDTFIEHVDFSLTGEKEICFLLKVASREDISNESLFILYNKIETMDKTILLRKYLINELPLAYEEALIRMTKLFGVIDADGRATWPSIQLTLG
jgi:hypothetical protein